jgi:methylase of polypeptide subunit release factors
MARAFPASRFGGLDFSDQALVAARAEADRLGTTNATFVEQDVASLVLAPSRLPVCEPYSPSAPL